MGPATRNPAVPVQTSLCQPVAWLWPVTSSSLRLCSFCSSIRFCRSASNCRLCSSFSRCCCSSCCRRNASDRSLFASCSRKKSRLSVDSPGRFRMELQRREASENIPSLSLKPPARGSSVWFPNMAHPNSIPSPARAWAAADGGTTSIRAWLTRNLFAKGCLYIKFLTKASCAAAAHTIFSCSQSTLSMNHCQLLKYYIISVK